MPTLAELSRYRFHGRSEQAVREEWIAPLLAHLGYGGDTLHEIRYEIPLKLAKPFRRIGRHRVAVDYTPTVYGRGLWIIEAKAAQSEDWQDAISQAWLYATHPEVDAPFMAVADGSRFAVYDTQRADWDSPEVDIATPDLARRFNELSAVLGAANVTAAVRTRRLRHLGAAMRTEVNPGRLDEYVREVKRLAAEAREQVSENRRAVIRDQFDREDQREREALAEAGLFAVGVWANQPFGVSKRVMGLGKEMLLKEPPERRREAYSLLLRAATRGKPPTRREFWNFRLTRLFIALTCADEPGCEFLGPEAVAAVRDHLLDFPDDPLQRAARRFERILPAFAGRLALSKDAPDLDGLARQAQQHLSDEARIRSRLSGDRLYVDAVLAAVDAEWWRVPWVGEVLDQTAQALEDALVTMTIEQTGVKGIMGDPHFVWHYETDMLKMGTLYELGGLIRAEHLTVEVIDELKAVVALGEDETRLVKPAQRLIDLTEVAGTAS